MSTSPPLSAAPLRTIVVLAAMITTTVGISSTAQGQVLSAGPATPEDEYRPPVSTVSATAAPDPLLRYALLPRFVDRRPGNAVVFYGKVKAEQNHLFSSPDGPMNHVHELLDKPLTELAVPGDHDWIVTSELPYAWLRDGALSDAADWQLKAREGRYFMVLIPEIQESRMYGRYLCARARIQIARGDYEAAIETIQTGYALARHVSQAPTLIASLVAVAIVGMVNEQLHELVQRPDAPNLYWALTELPSPLIDFRVGLETEYDGVLLTFPELEFVSTELRSEAFWRETLKETLQLSDMMGSARPPQGSTDDLTRWLAGFASPEFRMATQYPAAKARLVELGYAPERVERFPVSQVLLAASWENYRRERDRAYRWNALPLWQTPPEVLDFDQDQAIPKRGLLFEDMLAASSLYRWVSARCEREIALLRTIEALRLHAARTGELPRTLDELRGIPLPIDPLTGKVLEYRLEADGRAYLGGPPNAGNRPFERYVFLRPWTPVEAL